jgi:hypothetical protein
VPLLALMIAVSVALSRFRKVAASNQTIRCERTVEVATLRHCTARSPQRFPWQPTHSHGCCTVRLTPSDPNFLGSVRQVERGEER